LSYPKMQFGANIRWWQVASKSDAEKLGQISPEDESPKLAAAAGELGNNAERANDNRGEERFIWIMVCIVLFDCMVFMNMDNWMGPLIIGIIQIFLIIALAKKLRVEEIASVLTRFIDRVGDYPERRG
jgi:hypothetical protein